MSYQKVSDQKSDLSLRELRIYQALHLFLNSSDEDCLKACEKLRNEIQRRIAKVSAGDMNGQNLKMSRIDDAFMQLTQIKKSLSTEDKNINRVSELIQKAKTLVKDKKFDEALQIFEGCMSQIQPDNDILAAASTAALYSEAFDRAIYFADLLLKRSPRDAQAFTIKALAEMSLSNIDTAYELIQQAAQINPRSEIIQKYLKLIQSRMQGSKDTIWSIERSWKRVALRKPLLITDGTRGSSQRFHTLTLSAGGCLIEAPDLPEEFHFTLELGDSASIQGIGSTVYQLPSLKKGIVFSQVRVQDQELLNQEVLRAIAGKKNS